MTPLELGFVALFIGAFVLFMVTLFLVTWYVEKDAAPVPAKAARKDHGGAVPSGARHA